MADVKRCDVCKAFDDPKNRVVHDTNEIDDCDVRTSRSATLLGKRWGVRIVVPLPEELRYKDICQQCLDDIVRAKIMEVIALLTPYRPARVVGFEQGQIIDAEPVEQLTKAELHSLRHVAQKLLTSPKDWDY